MLIVDGYNLKNVLGMIFRSIEISEAYLLKQWLFYENQEPPISLLDIEFPNSLYLLRLLFILL